MKKNFVLLLLFLVAGHLQELKTILKHIENMQEQVNMLNNHIKELKTQPEHIKQYIQMANEQKP